MVGFALYLTLLASADYGSLDIDPGQQVAFLVDNQASLYMWNLIICVAFGVFLIVLALALYERLKIGSPAIVQPATAFGLIWAGLVIASGMVENIGAVTVIDLYAKDPDQAASVWLALSFVVGWLGGGNEIIGGLWVLLVSWAALRAGGLPRTLNYFGVLISVPGILTVIPALSDLGAIFGLGAIVWFIGLGIVMLRSSSTAGAQQEIYPNLA